MIVIPAIVDKASDDEEEEEEPTKKRVVWTEEEEQYNTDNLDEYGADFRPCSVSLAHFNFASIYEMLYNNKKFQDYEVSDPLGVIRYSSINNNNNKISKYYKKNKKE